jgi:hypothetical protein
MSFGVLSALSLLALSAAIVVRRRSIEAPPLILVLLSGRRSGLTISRHCRASRHILELGAGAAHPDRNGKAAIDAGDDVRAATLRADRKA